MSNSRLGRQVEAYRMARRIVRACNRMKAGQGVALQWCTQQRHVLHYMAQRVAMGLRKRSRTVTPQYFSIWLHDGQKWDRVRGVTTK